MNIFQILQKISLVPSYLWDKLWASVWKRCMKHCGKGVYIRPMSSDFKGLWNLSVGDGTSIPKGSTITGDHRIDILGKYMTDVTVEEKFVDGVNVYDQPVVIEDDVWCGANVTILKGVTIGQGSVVAAGAVVTKSFPPYSIIGGIPAKLLKMRFTEEGIREHERMLTVKM